jgi:hypothetical protein
MLAVNEDYKRELEQSMKMNEEGYRPIPPRTCLLGSRQLIKILMEDTFKLPALLTSSTIRCANHVKYSILYLQQ